MIIKKMRFMYISKYDFKSKTYIVNAKIIK